MDLLIKSMIMDSNQKNIYENNDYSFFVWPTFVIFITV